MSFVAELYPQQKRLNETIRVPERLTNRGERYGRDDRRTCRALRDELQAVQGISKRKRTMRGLQAGAEQTIALWMPD